MPTLTENALSRLRQQAEQDYNKPWKPGSQPTDAELLWLYIAKLREELHTAKDREFLSSWATNPDRMGGQFTQEEIERSRNGGW